MKTVSAIIRWFLLTITFCCFVNTALMAQDAPFRPPAVPLVTFSPYLSIWSGADKLTDKNTQHWTYREQSLVSLIRIDEKTYLLMGADPLTVQAFNQISLKVFPTQWFEMFNKFFKNIFIYSSYKS